MAMNNINKQSTYNTYFEVILFSLSVVKGKIIVK